jgi:hypothetical protein
MTADSTIQQMSPAGSSPKMPFATLPSKKVCCSLNFDILEFFIQ